MQQSSVQLQTFCASLTPIPTTHARVLTLARNRLPIPHSAGRQTVNTLYGSRVAVLAGDYLFAQASWLIANLENLEVIKLISKVIADFANGEISQASSLFDTSVTLQAYLDKSFYKTASLIAASARSSAVFSGLDEEGKAAMYAYGRHLGLAFQVSAGFLAQQQQRLQQHRLPLCTLYIATVPCHILCIDCYVIVILLLYSRLLHPHTLALFTEINAPHSPHCTAPNTTTHTHISLPLTPPQVVDDILDFTQTAEQLGKPQGQDLASGNLTAPVIYALQRSQELEAIIQSEFTEEGSLEKVCYFHVSFFLCYFSALQQPAVSMLHAWLVMPCANSGGCTCTCSPTPFPKRRTGVC